MITTLATTLLDAVMPNAVVPTPLSSLPSAGFRVCRAGDTADVIGMFTTHRADPSWT